MSKVTTIKIPFQKLLTVALSGGITQSINVSPNTTLSDRLAGIADEFDEYRFTSLRYRLHPGPGAAASSGNQVASFYPGIVDTAPTTTTANSESTNACVLAIRSTVPSDWSSIPRKTLAGMHTWYKSVPGTPESAEELQGVLVVVGSASQDTLLEVRGVCEFKAAINAGSTPAERLLAARVREKNRIMKLLATDSSGTAKPKPTA